MDIRNYFELYYHENTAYQNLKKASKILLSRIFITIQAYFRKKGRLKISKLNIHFKKSEKEQPNKVEGRKE